MFIYLSKKIAIPNNTKINAIAWNKKDGYIAVGGEGGLLKVLKLDSGNDNDQTTRARGLATSSNLSMNEALEGHSEHIQVLIWNETYRKLTTSDQNGVIIVWMMYKGTWYEEMINNRKKSTVAGMAWTADGMKICIIYEDGAVIVGSVEGNKIWGKELKNVQLSGVQWSPDAKFLLFSLKNGNVHLYDNMGNFTMQIDICCKDISERIPIVGLDWYNGQNGSMHTMCPNLAICYENGRAQIMRNENDTNPVILDTRMDAVHCSWNHNGSLLAIAGRQFTEEKEVNLVQFYSPFGEHLRTLKVPGMSISCCVWEGGSLRVALAVDSFIYFANIRPNYKWCYFKKTVVFTSSRSQKPGISATFWNLNNNQCHTIYMPVLLALTGYEDYCVLVTRSEQEGLGKYGMLLCNSLGTPVDARYVDIEVIAVTMNSTHVIATAKNNFIIWQYRTPKSTSVTGHRGKCRIYHIDDNPSGAMDVIHDLDHAEISVSRHITPDPACCIVCSDKCLIIGRESGVFQYYALPHLVLTHRYKIPNRPHKIAINCNSTRLSVIDVSGVMTLIDISEGVGRPSTGTDGNKLERKDVWAMCWASDNPQLLAIMEKTRMYIFKGIYPEEPVSCSGYICSFNDLEIQAIMLDEIMESPEKPNNKTHLIKLETKSLRDTKQLLSKVGIDEASQFITENPHPRLWRLLAEAALKNMNLAVAESSFIRSRDYARVSFVKKLKAITSEQIRKARVATYFKNFDKAEKIYMEADRSDLALSLRQTLGDWFRVIQILKNGAIAPDYLLKTAYNSTADYFMHINNWSTAMEYYELAGNQAEVVECLCRMEDFKKLENFIQSLPEGDPLLEKIGDMFASNAVISEGVQAYAKFGDINAAIELCILHNRWDTAVEMAKKYNITKIAELLMKYTSHLLQRNSLLTAIDINVQTNFYLHAALFAYRLADEESKKMNKSLLDLKKHYVFAGKLLYIHKKNPHPGERAAFDPLIFENAWKGAEAFHYYLLTHEQIYNGKLHDAVCTAYKLQDFKDYIEPRRIFSILALAAYLDRSFAVCSKAIMMLKKLPELPEASKSSYAKLAEDIFTKNEPRDYKQTKVKCSNCNALQCDWHTKCVKCKIHFPTCVGTGRAIIDEAPNQIWVCPICHHPARENFMAFQKFCMLCHSPK